MSGTLIRAHATALCQCPNSLRRPRSSLHSRPRRCVPSTKISSSAASGRNAVEGKEVEGKQQTLFAKLGGEHAVSAAVDLFYDKMIADSRVSYFFDGIDMKKQRAHQAAFLTFATGGSKGYEGNADMTHAHARLARDLDLRMEHFDIVLKHLAASLRDLHVPQGEINEVAALVETLRPAFQKAIDEAKE